MLLKTTREDYEDVDNIIVYVKLDLIWTNGFIILHTKYSVLMLSQLKYSFDNLIIIMSKYVSSKVINFAISLNI